MIVAVPLLALHCRTADTWQNARVISFCTEEEVRGGRVTGSVDAAGSIEARYRQFSTINDVVVLESNAGILALLSEDSWLESRDSLLGKMARHRKKAIRAAPGDAVRISIDGDRAVLLDLGDVSHNMRVLMRTRNKINPQAGNVASIDRVFSAGTLSPALAHVAILSTPSGADIEIDDLGSNSAWKPGFYGNTPSTVTLHPGTYALSLTKPGFQPWTKKLTVGDGQQEINIAAELVASKP